MMSTFTLEPTEENIAYIEAMVDLCSDYEIGFMTDEEFEAELQKLNKGRK